MRYRNTENSNLDFSELSFEYIRSTDFENFNSLELFKEDSNDIIIKIWFEDFKFMDKHQNEIDHFKIYQKQFDIWKTIFKNKPT